MSTQTGLDEAITAAGGLAALAKSLEETTQTVSNWRARGSVPANKCVAVERITGVSRVKLRPDDWAEYWPELSA